MEGSAADPVHHGRRYAAHVHVRLPEPLAGMMIASALTLDTALNQDERVD